jgi:putative membrane protein
MKSFKISLLFTAFVIGMPVLTFAAHKSSAELLSTVVAVDKHEINAAKTALEKKPSDEVRAFAEQMIQQHTDNMNQAQELAAKLNLSLEDENNMSFAKFKNKTKEVILKPFSGRNFEKKYMKNMVNGHQEVLKKLDEELIPNADAADVKTFLQTTRAAVAQHLTHAQTIHGKMA